MKAIHSAASGKASQLILASSVLGLALAVPAAASAATLSVGPGKTYAAPCAAFAAAKDGDIIEIAGGTTYSGDVCGIYRNNIIIRGVNGRPRIDAAGKNALGKGTWVVDGNNVTVENVEMLGAAVPDLNGAALRLEGTGFTLRTSFIHDNQDGILTGANTASDILIEYSEFGHNGRGDGQTHNLYIGGVRSLTFRYNFSHDANVGHDLKSRAQTNTIVYNRFSSTAPGQTGSTAAGQPSYEIDLPSGGTSYVIGNVIEQPSANQNPTMLAYGEEGVTNPTQDLYVVNNTFLNDYGSGGTFVQISSKVTKPALLQNNIFAGVGTITNQSTAISKTNYAAAAPGFVNRAAYDLHPTANALVINAGSAPGTSATGVSLTPVAQYKAVASGESRPVAGALDIGAYEVAATTTTSSTTTTTTPTTTTTTTAPKTTTTTTTTAPTTTTTAPKTTTTTTTTTAPTTTTTAPKTTTATTSLATTSTSTTWTTCATEGGVCSFSGTHVVRYGANGIYVAKTLTGPVACKDSTFGVAASTVVKSCSYATTK